MTQLENLRNELYKCIENGNQDSIIKASQELDKLILKYMKRDSRSNRKRSA